MQKILALFATALLASLPGIIRAGDLTPAEKDFFDKHISDVVTLVPTKLDDPAMSKVFAAPFYKVKIIIKQSDGGESNQEVIVARAGDKIVSVDRPSTDAAKMPDFQKMFNPDFKLNDDNAKILQQALDTAYPIFGDTDKKAEAIQHKGNQWTFVRGNFFDKKMGYVFDTDDRGAIKSISFVMKLP